MPKTRTPDRKNTAADLRARITAHIQRLAELTDQAAISDEIQAYLKTCSKFHSYSVKSGIKSPQNRGSKCPLFRKRKVQCNSLTFHRGCFQLIESS